jgi:parvulin-like peptidyl-prolyl isomerase
MKTICSLAAMVALAGGSLAAQQPLLPSHAPSAVAKAPAQFNVAGKSVDPNKVVARVNDVPITERDVREQSVRLFPYYSIHGGRVPDQYQGEIRQKAIQQLIMDELIYQEAKREKIAVPEKTMRDVLQQAKGRFGSEAAYQQYAKNEYGSVDGFEKRIRRAVVIAEFQNREIEMKSKLTDAQVRQVYEKNKNSFLRPESVWLQTISIELPQKPSEEQKKMARKRIEEILPQAKAAKTYEQFGVLAERVSEDDYRVMMGDRKWVHKIGLPKEIDQAIAKLKPGEMSGIVETPDGYMILRINGVRPQKQMQYDEVKETLRAQLQQRARDDSKEKMEQQLKKNAHIEVL